jgi:DNA recombination protein RmuC
MEWAIAVTAGTAMLASLIAAVFAYRAASGAPNAGGYAQFSDVVRRENELARLAAEQQARGLRQELSEISRSAGKTVEDRIAVMSLKLDSDIAQMGRDATFNRDSLRSQIDQRLDESAKGQISAAKNLREEVVAMLQQLGGSTGDILRQIGEQQQLRLDTLATELRALTEKNERGQETLRQTLESRLDVLRQENSAKLEEMRQTVDEKLQSTLEQRLGESFNRVVEQLERVHTGLGEMKNLAAGVGDLKKVLSNVSVRGTFGQNQLAALLEQFLSPEQYVKNAVVKEGTLERVEFAVHLPEGVLLPIDAKFPKEDHERLLAAAEAGDSDGVAEAGKALEDAVKREARKISEKYINPPRTTDFAILFLPSEGLYAEVLRRPGLFEQLQRDFHVTLTGPVTLTAFLNALQMGFRSLVIQKRSSEVWQVLSAVKTEFGRYNKVVDKLAKNLSTAANSVEELGKRTRVMGSKLKDVETVEGIEVPLLDFAGNDFPETVDDEEEEVVAAQ